MRIRCLLWMLVNTHWQQMPAFLHHPLTPFKQIIIFRDVPPKRMTGFPWYAFISRSHSKDDRSGNHPHMQLQCNGKMRDLHLGWQKVRVSISRHSQALCWRSCLGQTTDDVKACARKHFRLLTNCRLWFYWRLTLKVIWNPFIIWEGIDYEPMCFQ